VLHVFGVRLLVLLEVHWLVSVELIVVVVVLQSVVVVLCNMVVVVDVSSFWLQFIGGSTQGSVVVVVNRCLRQSIVGST
jgi:hypothetical protein